MSPAPLAPPSFLEVPVNTGGGGGLLGLGAGPRERRDRGGGTVEPVFLRPTVRLCVCVCFCVYVRVRERR